MLDFVAGLSSKSVGYDAIIDSVTEWVGEWRPLTVSTESADSGGEVFLTENVWASPKILWGDLGVKEPEAMSVCLPLIPSTARENRKNASRLETNDGM